MPALGLALGLPFAGAPRTSAPPPDPPSVPTGLMASDVTDTTATIDWTAGGGGGSVTAFQVEGQIAGGDWSVVEFSSSNPVTTYEATGLTASTEYDVRVRAVGPGGTSAWLTEVALFTTSASGTPSYDPPYGSGDRTADLVVTTSAGITYSGSLSRLVNGNLSSTAFFWLTSTVTGEHITVEFPVEVLITGFKYYQQTSTTQGDWKCQISTDGVTFTDVGAGFTLGGTPTQTVTTMSANTTGCFYWRILGTSGSMSNIPYAYQFEFNVVAL